MTQTATATRISLELGHAECRYISVPLYSQLSRGYEVCSVMPIPESVEAWRTEHRTARKRADRAARLGYRFEAIRREDHSDDIYAINTSMDTRQGRPMTAGYRTPQTQSPLPDYPCSSHAVRTYGVLQGDTLVAYLWLYRSGDLALVSQILGHGDHLKNDVMYLLVQGAIERETEHGGYLIYNRHDSGTDGLRYFKERLGFTAQEVQWLP